MQYIVVDMEWNQPWPGSYTARKPLPSPMRGEIIQIGAVRVLPEHAAGDEFQTLVCPRYFKKMNRKIVSLTGLHEAKLRAEGLPFPEAIERFRAWCGEECTFLAWGFDDITVLRENLALYGLDAAWADRWYNAQLIFNVQTNSGSAQKALPTAMELMGIEPTRPAHDALGDAYHTALICAKLDLDRGVAEYRGAVEAHENGFHGAELPGCLTRAVFHGYADKAAALAAMGGPENRCPACGGAMQASRWYSQQGRRYMALSACPTHGQYLVRVRLSPEEDGTLRVSRLVYEGSSDAAKLCREQAEKARPRRRRRRAKSAAGDKQAAAK
jgi:DNA polymerase III epsilon subunit-like protein